MIVHRVPHNPEAELLPVLGQGCVCGASGLRTKITMESLCFGKPFFVYLWFQKVNPKILASLPVHGVIPIASVYGLNLKMF